MAHLWSRWRGRDGGADSPDPRASTAGSLASIPSLLIDQATLGSELLPHFDDFAREISALTSEHLRVAAELEAAAQQHRLAAQRADRQARVAWAARAVPASAAHGEIEPVGSPMPADASNEESSSIDYSHPPRTPLGPKARDRPTISPSSGPRIEPATSPHDPDLTPHPDADVDVRSLGSLVVRTRDHPVTWGGSRHRTLFQYLVLHRGPVHREELMELVRTAIAAKLEQ